MFKHTRMFMATKTITITEDAYKALASDKNGGESFSEVLLRTHKKKGDISRFIGAWKHIPDRVIEDMKKDIERRRKIAGKQRMKEILKHFG